MFTIPKWMVYYCYTHINYESLESIHPLNSTHSTEFSSILQSQSTDLGQFWVRNWCTEFWHASIKVHSFFLIFTYRSTKTVSHGSGDNHQVQVLHLVALQWSSLLPHRSLVIGWIIGCHMDVTWVMASSISCKAWLSLLQFTWQTELGNFRGMSWEELGWSHQDY